MSNSSQPPKPDNSESITDDAGSRYVSGLEDVASSAWKNSLDMQRSLLGDTAEHDGEQVLPKVSLVADDSTNKENKELWDSFGNKASSDRGGWEFDSLRKYAGAAASTDIDGIETHAVGSSRSSDTARIAEPSKPGEIGVLKSVDISSAKSFSWLNSGWDSLFGSSDTKPEGSFSKEKVDGSGNKSETIWGRDAVYHQDAGGVCRVDGRSAVHRNNRGDIATLDKTSGDLSEQGVNGTRAILDKQGKYHIEDRDGNKLEYQNGQLMAISKDGTSTEVTDKEVIQKFRQSEWSIRHGRKRGDRGESRGNGKCSVESITDDKDDKQQMLLISDGKGTEMKVHQDGKKEISVGTGDDQTTFMIKPGSKEILAIRGEEKAIMRRENGEWRAFDTDGRPLDGKSGLGGALSGQGGELKISGSTTIRGDGTVDTTNDKGQHVEIGASSTSALLRDANGAGKDARIAVHGGTSTLQSHEESGIKTTTVDTNTEGVRQQETGLDGDIRNIFNLDPSKDDYLTIGTKDGDITVNKDESGHEKMHLWNGDTIDTDSHILDMLDGTHFDGLNNSIGFPDGLFLNEFGDVYEHDGFLNDFEELERQEVQQQEAKSQALVDVAIGEASRVAALAGSADPGDVNRLVALFSQLSGMKTSLAFSPLDTAMSITSAAINQAQVQIAQQKILASLATVSPDVLAQAHRAMPDSVSSEGLKQLLRQLGTKIE